MEDLTEVQRQLLSGADDKGRVSTKDSSAARELAEDLVQKGYLRYSVWTPDCYFLEKREEAS